MLGLGWNWNITEMQNAIVKGEKIMKRDLTAAESAVLVNFHREKLAGLHNIKKGCGNTNPGIYCKNLKCDYCDELKAKNMDNRLPEITNTPTMPKVKNSHMNCTIENPAARCRNILCTRCYEVTGKMRVVLAGEEKLPEINKLSVKDFKLWFDGFYVALCALDGGTPAGPLELLKLKISELE